MIKFAYLNLGGRLKKNKDEMEKILLGIEKAENETLSGNILYSIINEGNIK